MKKIIIFILFLTILPFSINAEESSILAKFGDTVITTKDLERIISYYEPERRKVIEENPQMKLAILKQIVTNKIVSEVAKNKGFLNKDNVKEQLELINEHFITSFFLKEEIIKNYSPSEKEIKDYYEKNRFEFINVPEQVRARHILIKLNQPIKEEEKKKALERAEHIIKQLKEGADFSKLVALYSDDPGTKTRGGDLGFFGRGKMVKSFEDAVFSLKPGEISQPVFTNYGIHIIKVEEKKEAQYNPFDSVKELVKKKVIEEKQKQMVIDYLEGLMKEKRVEFYDKNIFKTQ